MTARGYVALQILLLVALAGTSFAQVPLHREAGLGEPPPLPAPYAAATRVVSSTQTSTILEVTLTATDRERLPAPDGLILGLVAIGPSGNVRATIIQADASTVTDVDAVSAVDPSSLPSSIVTAGTPAIWRDVRVVEVSVAPSWSSSGNAFFAHRLLIQIENSGGTGANEKTRPPRTISPAWDRMYRCHVLNYDSMNLPRLTRGTGNRYLVISRTAFDAQTPQFVEWKTRQGYGVEVKTLESLGYSGSSITSQACLDATKNYILNAYNTWTDGLDFVLLVGDMSSSYYPQSVWTDDFYNVFGDGNRPHDQWYAFLEGSDVFADIMVGRFPDVDASRMGYALSKTVSYEKTPYINGTWQKNALMTLDTDSQTTTALKNLVSDILTAWGMNVTESFSYNWTNIIPTVNQGVTFYNYRGSYCDGDYWGGTFDGGDVAFVANNNKPGVWTVLSCSSAHFDNAVTTGELMLRHDSTTPGTPKGAVAFIGSQGYTEYDYNNPLDEGFYRSWTDFGHSVLGEAFVSGKIWAWNHMYPGFNATKRDCMMKEYTILGDPSLQVNTDVPDAPTVSPSHSSVPVGQTTNVTVTVTAPSQGPVQDALVCFRKANDVYVWGYTNASGQVSLALAPTSSGTIDLTMTAYNVQPNLGSIQATTTANPQRPENVAAQASGSNVVLTWSPVTQDVTGAPIIIDHYDVYRNTVAHYLVGGLIPITSPTGTTHTDAGILGDPSINHFYRVVAVATSGLKSAPSLPVGEYEIATNP